MQKAFKPFFFLIILLNLFFASWFVLNNDINFPSDIARDFFLLDEASQKKIVLIGPRSSTGLFHGPLWTYINLPAYLIGNGDPVAVGWFWVLITLLFAISSYYIGKSLFDKRTGFFFTLMSSTYAAFHAKGMFNPHGAMLLVPAFFYFFIKYTQNLRPKYLILNIVTGALIAQFQLAVGIPFLILSFLYAFYLSVKKKKFVNLLSFLLLIPLFSNFIIFDIKHDHILLNKALGFVSPNEHGTTYNYMPLIKDRVAHMLTSIEIIRRDPGFVNFFLLGITLIFVVFQIKNKFHKKTYLTFLYFYIGFFVLSFINKGFILYFYLFPIFPLVFLVFSSFANSKFKKIFIPLFFVVLGLNLYTHFLDLGDSKNFIGKNLYSWKFLNNLSKDVFNLSGSEFGYFVYSPDVLAYEPKYAMLYNSKKYHNKSFSFQKKAITRLLIAPPPQNNPFMKDDWWKKNQLRINSKPKIVKNYDNGYKLEEYELNENEVLIPFDPNIDPGLHFR